MARGASRERPVMELRITGIQDGDHPFSFEAEAEQLQLDRYKGKITVVGVLRKVSTQLFIESDVAGTLIGECDRCLAEVRHEVAVPMNLYYHVAIEGRGLSGDDGAEIQSLLPEQDTLVLDEDVRQTLLLHVPLKVLCREECAGLCPTCGADLNNGSCDCSEPSIDPRWARLADVFKKKDSE